MSHAADTIRTAEDLFAVMKEMPTGERVRFFTLLGKNAFEKENFTHDEVFGEVLNSEFTAAEAAEYLEVPLGELGVADPVGTLGTPFAPQPFQRSVRPRHLAMHPGPIGRFLALRDRPVVRPEQSAPGIVIQRLQAFPKDCLVCQDAPKRAHCIVRNSESASYRSIGLSRVVVMQARDFAL
jgi:hypothetical protein